MQKKFNLHNITFVLGLIVNFTAKLNKHHQNTGEDTKLSGMILHFLTLNYHFKNNE